ncbi:MAG: BrnT family toxin [Candidatus Sulfotelmatobacter sp.]
MEFTWDERKNRVNQRKHRVGFKMAILVFDDPFYVSTQDREVDGEARWQTIGMVLGAQILVVAHTVEDEESVIRILSARKATPRERRIYAQGY